MHLGDPKITVPVFNYTVNKLKDLIDNKANLKHSHSASDITETTDKKFISSEDKTKITSLITDGEGDKVLLDNGEYTQTTNLTQDCVKSVNSIQPQKNNIPLTLDNIPDGEIRNFDEHVKNTVAHVSDNISPIINKFSESTDGTLLYNGQTIGSSGGGGSLNPDGGSSSGGDYAYLTLATGAGNSVECKANNPVPFCTISLINGIEYNPTNYSLKLKKGRTYDLNCDLGVASVASYTFAFYNITTGTVISQFKKLSTNSSELYNDTHGKCLFTPTQDCEVQVRTMGKIGSSANQVYLGRNYLPSQFLGVSYFIAMEIGGSASSVDGTENINNIKLSDTYATKIENGDAANGVGASQNALYNAYSEILAKISLKTTTVSVTAGGLTGGSCAVSKAGGVVIVNLSCYYAGVLNMDTPYLVNTLPYKGIIPFSSLMYIRNSATPVEINIDTLGRLHIVPRVGPVTANTYITGQVVYITGD